MNVGRVLNTWRLEGEVDDIDVCKCLASRDGCNAMKQERTLTVLIRSYKEVRWSPPFGTPAAQTPTGLSFPRRL